MKRRVKFSEKKKVDMRSLVDGRLISFLFMSSLELMELALNRLN